MLGLIFQHHGAYGQCNSSVVRTHSNKNAWDSKMIRIYYVKGHKRCWWYWWYKIWYIHHIIYLDPETTVFSWSFRIWPFFWSCGICAQILNSNLHEGGGNYDTNSFPIYFSIFFNIVQYLFNIVQSCNFQNVSNNYWCSSNVPFVPKYCQIWAYDRTKMSFLQIRQYSAKTTRKQKKHIYIYILCMYVHIYIYISVHHLKAI